MSAEMATELAMLRRQRRNLLELCDHLENAGWIGIGQIREILGAK